MPTQSIRTSVSSRNSPPNGHQIMPSHISMPIKEFPVKMHAGQKVRSFGLKLIVSQVSVLASSVDHQQTKQASFQHFLLQVNFSSKVISHLVTCMCFHLTRVKTGMKLSADPQISAFLPLDPRQPLNTIPVFGFFSLKSH